MKNQMTNAAGWYVTSGKDHFASCYLPANNPPVLGRYLGLVGVNIDPYHPTLLSKVYEQITFGDGATPLLDDKAGRECQCYAEDLLSGKATNNRLFVASIYLKEGQCLYSLLIDALNWLAVQGVQYAGIHKQVLQKVDQRNLLSTIYTQHHETRFCSNKLGQTQLAVCKPSWAIT